MDFSIIFVSVGSSLIYSLIWFFRSVIDPSKPTQFIDFDPWQLAATLLVGAGVGIVSVVSGFELTQVSLEGQLLAYGFVIAAVQQFGSAAYRWFVENTGEDFNV